MRNNKIRYPVLYQSDKRGIKTYSIFYYDGFIETINGQDFFLYKSDLGWFVVDLESGCSLNSTPQSKKDAILYVKQNFEKWLRFLKTEEYHKNVYNYKDLLEHSKKKMKQMSIFD